MAAHDHEVVSIYGFSKDQINRLLEDASECVLMWATKDGWPVGVVHAFVWRHERIWLTFAAHRHRAAAIRRDPRVSVTVSGTARVSDDCPVGAVTVKGRAVFHEDQATKDWFYRALPVTAGRRLPCSYGAMPSVQANEVKPFLPEVEADDGGHGG